MGQRRNELTPERSPAHLWGSELRAWRDRRGLSLAKLGIQIRYDPSHLSRFERGERWPPEPVAQACDRALGAEGALLRLWHLASVQRSDETNVQRHEASWPGHVASDLPGDAADVHVQGASDTENGMIVPCRDLNGRIIWVSVPRRAFLLGGVGAASAIARPSHLTSRVGSSPAALARAAIPVADASPVEHLRNLRAVLVESDNILGPRHIVSTVEEHIALIGELRQPRSGADRQALLDMRAQYAEFAGWLHQDLGDLTRAGHWLNRALEWSHAAGDQVMVTYILARKSQLAGDMNDGHAAIDMADAAATTARPRSRLAAAAPTYAAHGHALLGEHAQTLRVLDDANDKLSGLDDDPASHWGSWLDAAYVTIQRARCMEILGDHDQAAEVFQQAISDLRPEYRRDRGVYLAREATAHAHAANPERAAAAGMSALAIASETGSGRIVHELARLDADLATWYSAPDVADLRAALSDIIPTQIISED
jgi:tetratricopeptide (TPR) repeat protein